MAKFHAGFRSTCKLPRTNSSPLVNAAPSPLFYHLPLSLVPMLMFFSCRISQGIEQLNHGRRSPTPSSSSSRPLLLFLETIEAAVITIGSLSSN
jgi:hypothetical protein